MCIRDSLYVSGTLGDARLALEALRGTLELPPQVLAQARTRLETPSPRVALGLALRGIASSAIDLSDGLLGDLGHILESSGVGALVHADDASELIAARAYYTRATGQFDVNFPLTQWRTLALAGGDDYELLFTAPASLRTAVVGAADKSQTPVTRIGQITAEPGLRLLDSQGQALPNIYTSFDHFS